MGLSDELYHYGIPGMKWGVRRTPEQLGHTKTSTKTKATSKTETKSTTAEDKAAAKLKKKKEQALKSPSKLYKYRNLFSEKEISDAIRMFQTEKTLYELGKAERNRGKEYADTALGYVDSMINAYNKIAAISNAVSGEKNMPKVENVPIPGSSSSSNKKKKK